MGESWVMEVAEDEEEEADISCWVCQIACMLGI